jgi:hypothetical protein
MNDTTASSRWWKGLVWGGVLAGLGDLLFAFVYFGLHGASPIRILQSIASGLLGSAAYDGGAGTAVLGFFLHFVVAFGAAAVYVLASRRLPFLLDHAVLCGLAYGVAVYFFMNLVVLPLSAFPREITLTLKGALPGLLAHMLLVGLPIALAARRFAR